MPLFDVPGWTVASEPVKEPATTTSKKRKRPVDHDEDKVSAVQMNLDKLMDTLKEGGEGSHEKSKRKRNKGRKSDNEARKAVVEDKQPKHAERRQDPSLQKKKGEQDIVPDEAPSKKLRERKKTKKGDLDAQPAVNTDNTKGIVGIPPPGGLTTFQNRMKQSLDGARFRWINEMLYKSDSEHAVQMMHDDPNMFQEYHTGFRHQVQAWPSNPVSYYVSKLESYPTKTVIADLGCGDAALARALIPKGMIVLSYDLVSDGAYVIAADICAKLPLPGSEGEEEELSEGEGNIVDVAVCALSLMGSNWPNCIREVWRILKPGGELKIAEVASRFTNVEQFLSLVSSIGFKLKSKDDNNTHFTLFEFKKVVRKRKNEKDWEKIVSKGSLLKPCEYKRR